MAAPIQIDPSQFNDQQKRAIELALEWYRGWTDGKHRKQIFFLAGYAGTGKAQPVSCLVQTPKGSVRIGDIKPGDMVIGKNGKPTEVLGVYPQGVQDVYEVKFRDGFSTRCNIDHLWTVTDKHKRQRTATLGSLLKSGLWTPNGQAKFQIPLCDPVEFEQASSDLFPPYVIGALIGDGTMTQSTPALSVGDLDMDIATRVQGLLPGYQFTTHNEDGCVQFTIHVGGSTVKGINPLMTHIREIGLDVHSGDKFIPDRYKYTSVELRMELLRGLMDTDGSCRANRCGYSTTSKRLAEDVAWLIQSLGGVAIIRISGVTEAGVTEYVVNVKTNFNPFHTPRKAREHYPSHKNPPSRTMWSATLIGQEDQVCIKVAADDSLYLTDNFIVTHNTTIARYIAEQFSAGSQTRVEFIAPTGKAASRLRQKGCQGAKTMHQFIYNVRGEDEEGEPIFVGKTQLDSYPRAVFMDEASMVGGYDLSQLKSHGLPILALGDIGQLPPVKAEQVFNENNTDVLLDQIERNAGNIARAAMFVRQGSRLPFREYEDVQVRPGRPTDDDLMAHIDADSQILAAYHSTREDINRRVRNLMGYKDDMPQIGEKIVCRFNQHAHNIMNGEQGIVIGFSDIPTYELEDNEMEGTMYVDYHSLTYGSQRRAKFNPACFYMGEHHAEHRKEAMKGIGAWDYGHCLTIHSSQGSEWDNVLMMDELMRSVPYAKLAYTGITRASKNLRLMRER